MPATTETLETVIDVEYLEIQALLKLELTLYPGDRGDRYTPPEPPSFEVDSAELVEVYWETHSKPVGEIIEPLKNDILEHFWNEYELGQELFDRISHELADKMDELSYE